MDGLVPAFHRHFVSRELGVMKPSPAVYAHVIEELGCGAGEIAFFDDGQENQENIDGVADAGYRRISRWVRLICERCSESWAYCSPAAGTQIA
jgi:FMN phosphatase YigB (HAD superfamily)